MYLKKTTLLLIVSIIFSFSIRISGTVFPVIFNHIFAVNAAILIHSLFILVHLAFWLVFYREYICDIKHALKPVCRLAIAGSLAVSVLYVKKLGAVFGMTAPFPFFFMSPYLDAIVPLISSIVHLIFFLAFKRGLDPDERTWLGKPVSSFIISILIFIFLQLMVMINLIATKKFEWLAHMPRNIAMGTVPLMTMAVFLMLFFYYRFYKFLNSGYRTGNSTQDVESTVQRAYPKTHTRG